MSNKTSKQSLLKMIIPDKGVLVNRPQLGLRVFFAGRCFFSGAVAMFRDAGCEPADNIDEAELVVFLGGEDIDPALYGDTVHRSTYFNNARDNGEIEIFLQCLALDIPMFGICRGMQFLHAMSGSKLYQNVSGHSGTDHGIIDLETGEKLMTTSLHHQMCIADGTQIPVAKCSESRSQFYSTGTSTLTGIKALELEAAYYPSLRAFATQGHPELGSYSDYSDWCISKIQRLYEEQPQQSITIPQEA